MVANSVSKIKNALWRFQRAFFQFRPERELFNLVGSGQKKFTQFFRGLETLPFYSFRMDSTGLAKAARKAWIPTVNKATKRLNPPANANVVTDKPAL